MREKGSKSPEGSGERERESVRSNCVFCWGFPPDSGAGGGIVLSPPVPLAFDAFLGRFLLPLPLLVP